MRYVALEDAKPGMRLAYSLFDSYGRTLIGVGCELTKEYIVKLEEFGFNGVYINDNISIGIEIEAIIPSELRKQGLTCVRESNIDGCKDTAFNIVGEIMNRGTLSLDMTDLRCYDDYTFAHSVNVAVICCVIGIGMQMKEDELGMLVTAALLHDLGKISIPERILNKPERLTQEEYQLMKSHSSLSYELIKERWDVSAQIKTAVLHHHENVDGSGYPDGITGDKQTIFTKILHVADVYDALISKRPYKAGYLPYEAVEYLMGACGIMFDKDVVNTLLQYVPLFPKGTMVTLSDGRGAIIYDNKGLHNIRPVVKLMDGTLIDLTHKEYFNITILQSSVQEKEVPEQIETARTEMVKEYKKYHIMIVDDMKVNLQIMKEILSELYELTLLKSGRQALIYLQKNPYPDLVIMDVDMPEMDGIETAKYVRQETNGSVPILFVTAISDKRTVLMCRELNVAGYILRPFKPVYIKSEIRRIITGRSDFE